jgi:uncharacterized DUF497 family protein
MEPGPLGFEWDEGNRAKCRKHGVSVAEIEALFDRQILIVPDVSHSSGEERLRGIGKTARGRMVFLVFTIRQHADRRLIRPISARFMHRKEIRTYEEENPDLQNR